MEKDKKAFGIDWCQENTDTIYFLNEILEAQDISKLNIDPDEDVETFDFLEICKKELENHNLVLCELGRGNDAYELFVLTPDRFEGVQEVCGVLRYEIQEI